MAGQLRKDRVAGIDPIEARKAKREAERAARASAKTFKQCAEAYIAVHKTGWRNEKHGDQWRNTFERHVWPEFGSTPVAQVNTDRVLKVLEPIWSSIPETASRIRGRIEAVLDWASARGYRSGDNPARWRGHLDHLLPAPTKVRKVVHHPALHYNQVGTFIAALRMKEGLAARALEFLILTATRTGETIGARWEEIDLAERLWVIPAHRIKSGREHRVPLSGRAVEILNALASERKALKGQDFVFPAVRAKTHLSSLAMLKLIARMGYSHITVHGFRSTFRDWTAETTDYSREVSEMSLAHAIGDKVEAAYRRGDLFEKRRRLINEWADFCAHTSPATTKDAA